jgi:hypothetical protein
MRLSASREEIQLVEDRELELMEQAELAKTVVARAERAAPERMNRHVTANGESRRTKYDDRSAACRTKRRTERGLAQANVDEEPSTLTQRLFSSKGDSAVVAFRA